MGLKLVKLMQGMFLFLSGQGLDSACCRVHVGWLDLHVAEYMNNLMFIEWGS